MNIRKLDWLETFTDRGDGSKDQTGWEADSGFGPWYSVEQYFGSDSYGFQAKLDYEVIADNDDPDEAMKAAQQDFEGRVQASMSSWEPIETAPRDGTELFFLRLPPYSATGNITIGFWHDGQNVPGFQSNMGGVIDTRIWNRWMLVPDAIALALADLTKNRKSKS